MLRMLRKPLQAARAWKSSHQHSTQCFPLKVVNLIEETSEWEISEQTQMQWELINSLCMLPLRSVSNPGSMMGGQYTQVHVTVYRCNVD